MRPFERRGETVTASFTALEVELLSDLAAQVVDLLADVSPDDPAVARLLPDAYRDDEEASAEFRRFTEHGLADRKIANAQVLIQSLEAGGEVELDIAGQQAWLRALTDIRLIIASRLGIETDDDHGRDESDEDLMMRDIYDWLAGVQGSLIESLE
jgi:erythromycin esterase-like protein